MEKVIKETDPRIPVPKIKGDMIWCPACPKDSIRWFIRCKDGFERYIKHFQKEHLKPKVYILYHTDPYDGCEECTTEIKRVQGIFSTKQLAEQAKKKIKSKIPYDDKDFEIESVIMDTRL